MKARHSKINVTPANWMNGGTDSMLKPWVISYYYFDENNIKGKQIRIKGMNNAATLLERREITKDLIHNENELLSKGYNPITHQMPQSKSGEINEQTFFIEALKYANENLICVPELKKDIKYIILRIEKHATTANLLLTPISEIRRRDIVKLLDMCLTIDHVSAYRYNCIKRNLSILYRFLSNREIVEYNFIKDIENIRQVKTLRKVISISEREKLYTLKETNYTFFRFIQIFFASGSRLTELLALRAKDCDLINQQYKIVIHKGAWEKEELKPIASGVLHYWSEVMQLATPEQYLFAKGLIPGDAAINRDQVTRRWKLWCMKGLSIQSSLYSLKHAHLDDIARTIGMNSARDLAGHTDSKTTMIYTHLEKQRRMDELKHVNIKL